jgi:cytochrome c55X
MPIPLFPRALLISLVQGLSLAGLGTAHAAAVGTDEPPDPSRQHALVHVVRQDCGSCHGMRLTGGLGPPLTASALADRPLNSLVATILYGRPGTPMPGWQGMLSPADAQWIAQQLHTGFPEEPRP